MSWKYTGGEPATYPDWIDKATGETLVAEPGQTYDITQAEGREGNHLRPEGPWERITKTSSSPAAGQGDKGKE